jgi:hypothetical protein
VAGELDMGAGRVRAPDAAAPDRRLVAGELDMGAGRVRAPDAATADRRLG